MDEFSNGKLDMSLVNIVIFSKKFFNNCNKHQIIEIRNDIIKFFIQS